MLYLVPEFYVCLSVGSEPRENSVTGSEKVFNSYIGHIKQVWTFIFYRWGAIIGEFYRRHYLAIYNKKFQQATVIDTSNSFQGKPHKLKRTT